MKQEFRAAFGKSADKPRAQSLAGGISKGKKNGRSLPPVTLRLTEDERKRLKELADGVTMSAYIRGCVFGKSKARFQGPVVDKKAIAQALALLGQSRIANNLNQLAYQANIGALTIEEREIAQIEEAYNHVCELRLLLIKALKV
ncbi:MAG: hypothetical protein GY761_21870 [Hyphomicrobiales bacterium]|nr:hypothetical protein [Hyphomicrobiales bacterium]